MERRSSDIDGPIFFEDFPGPADGPTFVLVHGLGGSHVNWLAIAPSLAERGRVLALDLPGFGRSPLAGRKADLLSNRTLLTRFIEQEANTSVVLVGNSMGGALAAMEAVEEPELVSGTVLIAPAMPRSMRTALDRTVAGFASAFVIPQVGVSFISARVKSYGAERLVQRMLALCNVDPSRVSADVVAAHIELARARAGAPDMTAAFLQGARSLVMTVGRRRKYMELFRAISTPTLLIGGEHDRLVPRALLESLARVRPDWDFALIEDTGHTPMLEDPLGVLGAIDAWLSGPASWLLCGRQSLAGEARAWSIADTDAV
jgi:pimeloyl-ACP methyl ester carboxylesterase